MNPAGTIAFVLSAAIMSFFRLVQRDWIYPGYEGWLLSGWPRLQDREVQESRCGYTEGEMS